MQPTFRTVRTLDLLLNRDNARHVHKDEQEDIISYLLSDEEVYNLARHMSQHGVNPLEVVAVFRDEDNNLIVAEGNRRVCAAQLLIDYRKAPEAARKRFKSLAAKSADVSRINIAEFNDYATAQPWLQILHDGEQDGIGRRRWKPDQKARATTNRSTNALAVALLDYAERERIVGNSDRQGIRVSTATRYLANPAVREAMGIVSGTTSDQIVVNTDSATFKEIATDFIVSIQSGELHSRSVSKDWLQYASKLKGNFGNRVGTVTPAEVGQAPATSTTKEKSNRSKKANLVAPDTSLIRKSDSIIEELNKLGSFKLSNLYMSLTTLRLDDHPAISVAGAWIFIESLTALHGRNASTDFISYLSSRFRSLDLGRSSTKDCKTSLEYISQNGNAQKHSAIFSSVDARNLYNHFEVLDRMLVSLISACIVNKQAST